MSAAVFLVEPGAFKTFIWSSSFLRHSFNGMMDANQMTSALLYIDVAHGCFSDITNSVALDAVS